MLFTLLGGSGPELLDENLWSSNSGLTLRLLQVHSIAFGKPHFALLSIHTLPQSPLP